MMLMWRNTINRSLRMTPMVYEGVTDDTSSNGFVPQDIHLLYRQFYWSYFSGALKSTIVEKICPPQDIFQINVCEYK